MQLFNFCCPYSFYLLFCDVYRRSQYLRHFVVKASPFLCTYNPWTKPSGSLWRKSCGTIRLCTVSVFQSWSEASWGQHDLPICSSENWIIFFICRKIPLFLTINFKITLFLKSSKRHSHSMRQGLKLSLTYNFFTSHLVYLN